jgi:exosortase A
MEEGLVTSGTIALTLPTESRRAWCLGALIAILGISALLLLFHIEAVSAVQVWYDSTAYGHCFFVLPIALWLAWDRRHAVDGLTPEPTAWPVLAAVPVGCAWFVAERLGIMEGRQLAATTLLEIMLVCTLGWRLSRVFAVPLAYLYFLVPFGAFLTPVLQRFTAHFVAVGLDMLQVPNFVDSFTIEIPEGVFYVAEACAGLRFLIAAIAFAVVYACMIYRSPWRRVAFIAVSCVVPVIANGLRALGTVELGHLLGSAEAAEADHLLYGWIFFSIVILLLIAAGLPFREDNQPVMRRRGLPSMPFSLPHAAAALVAVLAVGAAAPLGTQLIDREIGSDRQVALPAFVAPDGCTQTAASGGQQVFACGGATLTAFKQTLPARASWAQVQAALRDATGERDAAEATTSNLSVPGITPRNWRVVELREPDRLAAAAIWIDGNPNLDGLARRMRQAEENLTGGTMPPLIIAASVQPRLFARAEDRDEALRLLQRFLQAQGSILQQVPTALRAVQP